MTSGLIYIAIIGMWVAYFAPRWIHDRNEFSGKSVERFKSALRVVANQSPQTSTSSGAIHIDLDHEAKVRQSLLRRRITFVLIAFSLITTVVGGIMNTMPFIYAAVPLSGILIYVANVRRHVIADQMHMSERELKGVVILPKGSAAVRNAWEPTEVPVPTYVNAPKAVTAKRVIDLTTPGQWSEEQERLEREALAAASPSRAQIFDQQLADEAVERLSQARAANE